MRNIVTAILAIAISGIIAAVGTVVLAGRLQARQEFVPVLMALAPFLLIVGVALLIASYRPDPKSAVTRVARWLVALLVLSIAGLFGYAFFIAQARIGVVDDLPILAALAVPASLILVVQWLVFRLRARPAGSRAMQFGRGGAIS